MSKFKIRHLFVLMMLLSVPMLLMAQVIPGDNTVEKPCPCGEDSVQLRQSSALRSAYIGAPPTVPNITPPSPQSMALDKFLGYPISHATGLVDVSIPVFNVEAGDFTIPLQLKYHSSGVKTQEAVGIVGRNWTLTPGFRISRTVYGKPDEVFPVEFESHKDYTVPELILMCGPSGNEQCNYLYGAGESRAVDSQYDVFTLHLPHTSVSFILQNNNGRTTVRMSPEKPLTITPVMSNNRLYAFNVTDENGILYSFGETSHTVDNGLYTENSYIPNYPCFSAWALREATLPCGERVTFTYHKFSEDTRALSQTEVIIDAESWLLNGYGCDFALGNFLSSPGYLHDRPSAGNSLHFSLVPASIVTPTQKVTFNYSAPANRRVLNSIKVENYMGTQLRLVTLGYTADNKLLKKVTTSGVGSYTLKYKDEDDTAIDRSGFDWWGYYNGRSTGGIPEMRLIASGNGSHDELRVGTPGVTRDPDARYMDARSLQEITYPTGGKFSIDYEPHRFKDAYNRDYMGAGIRVKSTKLYDPVSGKTTTKSYQYEEPQYPAEIYPTNESLITESELCRLNPLTPVSMRHRVVSVFPVIHQMTGNSVPVWYKKVTELSDNGKTEYTYDYSCDAYRNQWDMGGMYHIMSDMYRMADSAPRLLRQIHYRKEGGNYTKAEETINTYSSRISRIEGLIVLPYRRSEDGRSICKFAESTLCYTTDTRWYVLFDNPVRKFQYTIALGDYVLTSTEKKSYMGSSSLTEKTSFVYNSDRPYNIREKRTLTSTGQEMVERYYYADDNIPNKASLTSAQQTAINQMKTDGIKATVIQQTAECNGKQLYSKLTGFKRLAPRHYVTETEYYRKGTGSFEKRFHCHAWDPKGNPRYVTLNDTNDVVYIWGYRGSLLLAEIKGCTLAKVNERIDISLMNSLTTLDKPLQEPYYGRLKNLHFLEASAFVNIWEYDPGVGVTWNSDIRGIKTRYMYDNVGRLIKIESDRYMAPFHKEYFYNYVNN